MAIISKCFKRLVLIWANLNYKNKRLYLIRKGATIGENTRLNCNVEAFGSEPFLVKVGDDCLFASNIHLITHDGGVKVLNSLNAFQGRRMDIIAPIKIGNNVYIGMGAYIMPGVEIGDNSIIGAGAIVTKSIPSQSVAVGIPAKVIKTIDEYYNSVCNKGYYYETANMSEIEKRRFFEEQELNLK